MRVRAGWFLCGQITSAVAIVVCMAVDDRSTGMIWLPVYLIFMCLFAAFRNDKN